MTAFELLDLMQKPMKCLSECDIKIDDYRHIDMYLEFKEMVSKNTKREYIKHFLANKYKMSESSVVRIVRRFDTQVKL